MNCIQVAVRVRAPSRLHFGLLSFGEVVARQFGGVGVMVERPGTEVDVAVCDSTSRQAPAVAERRAQEFANRFVNSLEPSDTRDMLANVCVRVRRSPPEHVGLGSGTQLAMAVARA